ALAENRPPPPDLPKRAKPCQCFRNTKRSQRPSPRAADPKVISNAKKLHRSPLQFPSSGRSATYNIPPLFQAPRIGGQGRVKAGPKPGRTQVLACLRGSTSSPSRKLQISQPPASRPSHTTSFFVISLTTTVANAPGGSVNATVICGPCSSTPPANS